MSGLLRQPSLAHLEEWREALIRGWAPSTTSDREGQKQLDAIAKDPAAFILSQWDTQAAGPKIELPDGTLVERLPSVTFVIWERGFCGLLSLRFARGSTDLPATCLGHMGYGIVPWRRGEGLATRAVQELQDWLPSFELPFADAAILPDNEASLRTMQKAGATYVGDQQTGAEHGHKLYQLWRFAL